MSNQINIKKLSNMKNIFIYKCIIFLILVFFACKEEANSPLVVGDKPDPITEYTVESLPGGAKIVYKINSEDFLYAKVVYEILPGVKREAKSSLYRNYLTVDGFGKEGKYNVELYAVGKGEVESEPTKIEIETLTPPYITAFNNIKMNATFGGINVEYKNEDEDNLVFNIIYIDTTNHWKHVYSHYTRFAEGNFTVRGFDTLNIKFGAYVRDRWGNISDTLTATYKPLFESLLDYSKIKAMKLPGEVWQAHTGAPHLVIEKVWNNNTSASDDCFHTTPNSGMPQHFSFDMGDIVKLSRFKYFQRPSTLWRAGNPKVFELWGSNNPDPNGSWDNWTKIGTFTAIKPSGLPVGTETSEDLELARAGLDFDIPITTEPYRYYRWNTIETMANVTYISIAELTFWGSVVKL